MASGVTKDGGQTGATAPGAAGNGARNSLDHKSEFHTVF